MEGCVCHLLTSALILCLSPISNPLLPPIVGAVTQWDVSNYLSLKPGCYDDSSRRAQSKLGRLVWKQRSGVSA